MHSRITFVWTAAWFVLSISQGLKAQTSSELRQLLLYRVGSLETLRVPANDSDLPQPRNENGDIDPRFSISEEKRYLGKLLFHDPIMTTNIRPEFGGDPATRQTASCSSCHVAEAATKAGATTSIGIGGMGRLYPDLQGNIIVRRTQSVDLVDDIPTGINKTGVGGELELVGALDSVDSPPRSSPTVIGFAFNNRLTWDGAAGEPSTTSGGDGFPLNPEELPAGENFVQLALRNHRMSGSWDDALRFNDVYYELFARAFPQEYRLYRQTSNTGDFVNENTVRRAIAGFLRTVISRDTPWDRFLAGDDSALDSQQLRGAWLFAASAADGGADCISCHSGPNLNKQLGDESGLLVEENFVNVGIGEHPLHEMAREVLGSPDHRDRGRNNVTGDSAHNFRFKTPTLRQSRDAGPYMHDGSFVTLRDVVEYFNKGVPAGLEAGSADSLSSRFSEPRGPGTAGLGLSAQDVAALVEFLDSGLYDRGLVWPQEGSPTRSFNIEYDELQYDEELRYLGAQNGALPSLLTIGNHDDQSIRDVVFKRGDVNGDNASDMHDAIFILYFLFVYGAQEPSNYFAADVNDNSVIDLTDPLDLLKYALLGGVEPAAPFPNRGMDWTR